MPTAAWLCFSNGASQTTEVHGLLQMHWIELPSLGAAHAASIHQRTKAASAIVSPLFVGVPQADPGLAGQISHGPCVFNVSTYKPFPPDN